MLGVEVGVGLTMIGSVDVPETAEGGVGAGGGVEIGGVEVGAGAGGTTGGGAVKPATNDA